MRSRRRCEIGHHCSLQWGLTHLKIKMAPNVLLLFPGFLFLPILVALESANGSEPVGEDSAPTGMRCFYCRYSNRMFDDPTETLNEHAECLSLELFANHSQYQRTCSEVEGHCMTSVSTLNGFFVEMRRDCAERCRPGCAESGYGMFSRQCTRCCPTPFCNDFDGRQFLLNDLAVQQIGGRGVHLPESGVDWSRTVQGNNPRAQMVLLLSFTTVILSKFIKMF